ncbi:hypothetical protein JWJ90_01085 [Desulfobulbus rhabdoformis]|uniref:hypothetical protein n=1 Tax=Desulfobulbus rhabdoformis TaxID=34032 RepID=UPI001965953F|nr:hypothetical protein [Desulfobulbus rhabdoformis]MBM9612875.1 hypothetical protein [Desulfobulbus rhabdoformis]
MHLLKFHIIGHQSFPNTSWIDVGEGVNILATSTIQQAQVLLEALQAINPPYDCRQVEPFADFPAYSQIHPYKRKIIPSKKTAAIAIYTADPALVQTLATIDPLYFETDRIEVGRRRDYSRWMNFVELPASARWKEIYEVLRPLLSHIAPEAGPWRDRFQEMIRLWQETDRLRGERAHQLSIHLRRLRPFLPPQYHGQLNWCCQRVDLAAHFLQAKTVVATSLPIFYALPPTNRAHTVSVPLTFLANRLGERFQEKLKLERTVGRLNRQWQAGQAGIRLEVDAESGRPVIRSNKFHEFHDGDGPIAEGVLASFMQGVALLHQVVYGCDPIFLLDLHRLHLPIQEPSYRLEQLHRICDQFQCLIVPDQALLDVCHDPRRSAWANFPWLHIAAAPF